MGDVVVSDPTPLPGRRGRIGLETARIGGLDRTPITQSER